MNKAKLPRCGGYCRPGRFTTDAQAHALAALSPAQLRAGVETNVGKMLASMCAVLLLTALLLGCKALRALPETERPAPSKSFTSTPAGRHNLTWFYE